MPVSACLVSGGMRVYARVGVRVCVRTCVRVGVRVGVCVRVRIRVRARIRACAYMRGYGTVSGGGMRLSDVACPKVDGIRWNLLYRKVVSRAGWRYRR